uniref:Uncharacterized protein n=1 Tax=Acrobeloides nanus TaxID=290746 RepID=A0A914DDM0_9BILA
MEDKGVWQNTKDYVSGTASKTKEYVSDTAASARDKLCEAGHNVKNSAQNAKNAIIGKNEEGKTISDKVGDKFHEAGDRMQS